MGILGENLGGFAICFLEGSLRLFKALQKFQSHRVCC